MVEGGREQAGITENLWNKTLAIYAGHAHWNRHCPERSPTLFLLPPFVSDSWASAGWSQGHGLQVQVMLWSDQKNERRTEPSISLKKPCCQKQSTDCLGQILAERNSMYITVVRTLHSRLQCGSQIETTGKSLCLENNNPRLQDFAVLEGPPLLLIHVPKSSTMTVSIKQTSK